MTWGLLEKLGGEVVCSSVGSFHLRRQSFPCSFGHGPFPLERAKAQLLDPWLGQECRRPLYLDTETTGLAGGSGTYAFLIGLAYFEGDQLQVEQLLMREHCEEKALLSYLLERVEQSDSLVTFNGKSFDIPLLQTRLVMNRLRYDLEEVPHLDLLPVSRRLWSLALENCRLETLEEQILGLPRVGDVPGWMVPQLYFRFLECGDARGLAQVAEHNRRDVLTMLGLMSGLGPYLQSPLDRSQRFCQRPQVLTLEDLALGNQAFRQRRFDEALALLERSWQELRGASSGKRLCGGLLARTLRRLGRVQQSQQTWRDLALHFPSDPEVLEQVAKQHEHVAKDYSGALHWVDKALELKRLPGGRRKRLTHRRRRLLRKLAC